MRKYVIQLVNGGKLVEVANYIIVRNDCIGSNLVVFMKEDGYCSLSEKDIKHIYEDGVRDEGGKIYLTDQPHMNTDQFCRFLKQYTNF
jgi:hypothetical protein